jgi:hypothetical protein
MSLAKPTLARKIYGTRLMPAFRVGILYTLAKFVVVASHKPLLSRL